MRSGFLVGFFILIAAMACGVGARADSADPASGAVEWQVGSSLYLAGRDYNVSRKVNGSLTATGETIFISQETTVAKDAWIAGRHVAVEGTIKGNLSVRAQDALINGIVKGNVSFYGMHLAFGPDARVDGDVDYFAGLPAEIDAGAKIKGAVKSSVLREAPFASDVLPTPDYGSRFTQRERWTSGDYSLSWWGIVWFGIAAGLIVALWPAAGARLVDGVNRQAFAALVLGFLWLIVSPILAVVAAFTIIGLPLAFIILMLWPLSVLAGIVAVILTVGDMVDRRLTFVDAGLMRRLAGVIVGAFLLRLFVGLPGIGSLIGYAAVSFGIGAMVLVGRSRITA